MAAKKTTSSNSVLARLEDGTIQLTLSIPVSLVQSKKEEALKTLVEKLEVPGFRKGKAPNNIASKHIDKQDLYNELLNKLLPQTYVQAIQEHKLKPILNPRFEILSVDEGKDWTVRAVTTEAPKVEVGDYRKTLKDALGGIKIILPGEGENGAEVSREDKEQKVIEALIKNSKAQISELLIEDEINHKLSRLLDQTQKLGLTVEQYLASSGKTIEQLRSELRTQAQEAITLELALNKIADEEKVEVQDKEVDQAAAASGLGEQATTMQQKAMIKSVLKRRKALDRLISLA